jgi:hypothetical protein
MKKNTLLMATLVAFGLSQVSQISAGSEVVMTKLPYSASALTAQLQNTSASQTATTLNAQLAERKKALQNLINQINTEKTISDSVQKALIAEQIKRQEIMKLLANKVQEVKAESPTLAQDLIQKQADLEQKAARELGRIANTLSEAKKAAWLNNLVDNAQEFQQVALRQLGKVYGMEKQLGQQYRTQLERARQRSTPTN